MLTIRWTVNKDGRLTATFVRPQTQRLISLTINTPHPLSVDARRTRTVAAPQRAAPIGRTPEPEPDASGRLVPLMEQ
jgi:hypothetical protein